MNARLHAAGAQRQRGQSATEFLIVFPVVILLVFGIIQMALLYQGRATLNYATMLAARAGALHNGDASAMRNAFARGLAPLFAATASPTGFAEALAKASAETSKASFLTRIEVLNPTDDALKDFGRDKLDGKGGKELPNDTLSYRSTAAGGSSKISIQDANLLHLRVTYCYRLIVPVIGRMLRAALNSPVPTTADGPGMSNPFGIGADPAAGAICSNPAFAGPRIEVRSEAIVRMQSPFFASNTGSSGSTTTPAPGAPGNPGFPGTPGGPGTPGTDPGDPDVPGVPGVPTCP